MSPSAPAGPSAMSVMEMLEPRRKRVPPFCSHWRNLLFSPFLLLLLAGGRGWRARHRGILRPVSRHGAGTLPGAGSRARFVPLSCLRAEEEFGRFLNPEICEMQFPENVAENVARSEADKGAQAGRESDRGNCKDSCARRRSSSDATVFPATTS